ncbi:MAG TPA: hypothetical protein VFK73_06695 [Paludibacter sp.]|nr:hypothetical protein [Paludibacter sp.]
MRTRLLNSFRVYAVITFPVVMGKNLRLPKFLNSLGFINLEGVSELIV